MASLPTTLLTIGAAPILYRGAPCTAEKGDTEDKHTTGDREQCGFVEGEGEKRGEAQTTRALYVPTGVRTISFPKLGACQIRAAEYLFGVFKDRSAEIKSRGHHCIKTSQSTKVGNQCILDWKHSKHMIHNVRDERTPVGEYVSPWYTTDTTRFTNTASVTMSCPFIRFGEVRTH